MRQAVYNQYASRREFKNNNHLLTIKMKPGESLKRYVSYFQNQMTLVYNCNEDVPAAAFISGLQVTYFYKHLVKYEVTKMKDILFGSKNTSRRGCDSECSQLFSQRRERRGKAEATSCFPKEESEPRF